MKRCKRGCSPQKRPVATEQEGGVEQLLALASVAILGPARAQNAYITNAGDNTVSVINTATSSVIGDPIPVGNGPFGVVVTPDGSKVYVTNEFDNTVSVIDTATNTVIGDAIPVGSKPLGMAVTPDGSKVYVTNAGDFPPVSGNVSVIDTATNAVVTTLQIGAPGFPAGVTVAPDGRKVYVLYSFYSVTGGGGIGLAVIDTTSNTRIPGGFIRQPFESAGGAVVTPDGSKIYVISTSSGTVSMIDTATNGFIGDPISVGQDPFGVAVTPDGSKAYVTSGSGNTVSVIDTASNTVIGGPISVGKRPLDVAVTPDGSKAYVVNSSDDSLSVIDIASNTVIGDPIPAGSNPTAFGQFIQPATKFAGRPRKANCRHASVDALVSQYGELNDAAQALTFGAPIKTGKE